MGPGGVELYIFLSGALDTLGSGPGKEPKRWVLVSLWGEHRLESRNGDGAKDGRGRRRHLGSLRPASAPWEGRFDGWIFFLDGGVREIRGKGEKAVAT